MSAKPKKDDDFAGLTRKSCCDGCTSSMCVITYEAFCGHPFKASLPGATKEVFERVNEAKRMIRLQEAEAA